MINTGFLHVIDILGTFSFAVSGAFFAMEKRLDPFGVLILSFVTAIGGGTLRDMMIGNLPVGWLRDGTATLVIFRRPLVPCCLTNGLKNLTVLCFCLMQWGLGCLPSLVLKKQLN
ncbi:MAG: TRIC cation channel family protein [Ferruginibacter sp.]